MKRKKLLSVTLAAVMTMSLAACGSEETAAPATTETPAAETTETPAAETTETTETTETAEVEEEVSPYTVITDADGNPIDLGGMHITIRDWWSSPQEPSNDYEEAREEYHEWLQETYNFTMEQVAISDWGTTPTDFVDYVTTGGDDNNYAWIIREDPAITSAIGQGLMYELSTLDCIVFSDTKVQQNKLHEQFTTPKGVYAMYAGVSEPRTGVYFNKRVLTEAGIDPESIYDMQANGTWTWDAFADMMAQVHRDTDNDGVVDVYGLTLNEGVMDEIAVYSNNSEFIGRDANGYVYKLEDPATIEALEWVVEMFAAYDNHDPEDAAWDYYKEEFLSGKVGFMVEDEYAGTRGNFLEDVQDELGFVMFPKGPQASTYVNRWSNNPTVIPGCYDEQRAWNIAFAWNLWTDQPAGYEDYIDLSAARAGIFDERAIDETIPMMMMGEHGMITYAGMIPNLEMGPQLTWNIGWWSVVSEVVESTADLWKGYVDAANGN